MSKPRKKSKHNINDIDFDACTPKQLQEIKRKIDRILKRKQTSTRQDLAKSLEHIASKRGIDLNDIFVQPLSKKPKSERGTTVAPKYEYKGIQWSGRGRYPNIYKEYFDAGGAKKDLLIQGYRSA